MRGDGTYDSDMKMTGLILAQSALVGLAVGVYASGLWLPISGEDSWISGMTYAMGALAVQTIAYYFFKMFFEQQMQERVQLAEMQRTRQLSSRQLQVDYEQRRSELELRMQEAQLENELRWMMENPDKVSPTFVQGGGTYDSNYSSPNGSDYHSTAGFNPGHAPDHAASIAQPLNLGATRTLPLKKDGTPDLRYKVSRSDE